MMDLSSTDAGSHVHFAAALAVSPLSARTYVAIRYLARLLRSLLPGEIHRSPR